MIDIILGKKSFSDRATSALSMFTKTKSDLELLNADIDIDNETTRYAIAELQGQLASNEELQVSNYTIIKNIESILK